jgi:hypothetical protein
MPDDRSLRDAGDGRLPDRILSVWSALPPLPGVAFWLAISLPVLYVPFLVTGIDGLRELGLFLALICLHLGALYGGRSYDPD